MQETYHYPPEFMSLMVDCIPLLNRSKRDLLSFFRGAGVENNILLNLDRMLREGENKYSMTRYVLTFLNEKSGNDALRQRREIVRRVVEFDSFEHCWPDDRFKAKGLVAEIRELQGKKDAFARMNQERDNERKLRMAERNRQVAEINIRKEKIDNLTRQLSKLFTSTNPHERGKSLESILNDAFGAWGILIRESITLQHDDVSGVAEQLDGAVEIDGHIYLVEMKWLKTPMGVKDMGHHLSRIFLRNEAGGIVISASGFTEPAIKAAQEALSSKTIVLVHLQELYRWMEEQADIREMLRKKIQCAVIEKNPFV